jgi:hypothetical protein
VSACWSGVGVPATRSPCCDTKNVRPSGLKQPPELGAVEHRLGEVVDLAAPGDAAHELLVAAVLLQEDVSGVGHRADRSARIGWDLERVPVRDAGADAVAVALPTEP